MAAKVPTLSTSGFVGDIAEKCDRLMSYYFVSDASQSNLFRGKITSLPFQVQQNGHDEALLRDAIQRELDRYLTPHFDGTEIDVATDIPNTDDPNRINVTLRVIVTEDGKQYSLGRLISVINSKINKIVDINNTQGA
jgi:hypothetical protein